MNFISKIKNFFFASVNDIEKLNLLVGLTLSKLNSNNSWDEICNYEFSVFSQWGEDGIIDWLIQQLPIIPKTFIEFGVENYKESNTRFLLKNKNWTGLVIDGSAANIKNISRQDIFWRHNLKAVQAFISSKNINSLIFDAGFKDDIGILSIDIDGNDYWVWEAINIVNPAIVVCEYNAVLGDLLPITIPYSENFVRSKTHFSNLYFGCSIQALISLGIKKGYTFIGTTSTGANAFFVKENYAHSLKSLLKNITAYPSKFREARNENGCLQYTSGRDRKELIRELPFLNLNTGKVAPLSSYGEIYSLNWQKGESVNL